MKIIQLVLQKFLLVVEKIIELLNGKCTYPEFEMELKKLLNDLGREICKEVLYELDQNIYYKNKQTGETAYLTDKAAGIQKYERIDAALKADITDLSTIFSYQLRKIDNL